MTAEASLHELWQLTKPGKPDFDSLYLTKLGQVLSLPKPARFETPFEVRKKNGGARKIVPAKPDLMIIQRVLAQWLQNVFQDSKDYCYTGKGVVKAVEPHLSSNCALIFDLKSAFDYVTAARLKFAIQRRLSMQSQPVERPVLDALVDLLTYPVNGTGYAETTPQGCVSTPYFYNLVVDPIDQQLDVLQHRFGTFSITRYSDNICISSKRPMDLFSLEKSVKAIVRGNGFELSWVKQYTSHPYSFLGTMIYKYHLELDPEKYGEYMFILMEALDSPYPKEYHRQILGIYNWAYQICGKNIPDDMFWLLVKYFEKIRSQPKSMQKLISQRINLSFDWDV